MNREILFRGKRTDNGEWFKGFYAKSGDKSYIIYDNDIAIGYVSMKEIIPETRGEYTGLTDKNGKKIFEGDILKQKTTKEFAKYNDFEWEHYGIVKFGEYDWCPDMQGYRSVGWYVEPLRDIPINPSDYRIGNIDAGLNQDDILDRCYPYEVIGNIHDNPELLEVQHE